MRNRHIHVQEFGQRQSVSGLQVRDDDIRLVRLDGLERFQWVFGTHHFELPSQHPLDKLRKPGFVDDEDPAE